MEILKGRFFQIKFFLSDLMTNSEKLATIHTIIIPSVLAYFTKNVLIGLCWIFLMTVIYIFVQKEKKENARMFFTFLKNISLIGFMIVLFSCILVIG
ncbi:hypothetical protein [Aliarcobacter butzleri]|uniref:hypothetical protein n=1 Tax=Aliarcobacter butzleri TaxID=28197 RepID=UPI002B2403B5|nr:hypothetical protein [Aliarcobacter butzleri]